MTQQSIHSNEIINLLSMLKDQTPDYPSDLMAARKAALMKQVVTIRMDKSGRGGKGGGDGGGSLSGGHGGAGALGGMSTAQSILVQAVIGVWIIAAMLTAAYVFRDEIIGLLQDYGIVSVQMTQVPFIDSPVPAPESPAEEIISSETPPAEIILPSGTAVPGNQTGSGIAPNTVPDTQVAPDTTDNTKDNQGLHLGQTPGAPDTPNQDTPNKPDKQNKNK